MPKPKGRRRRFIDAQPNAEAMTLPEALRILQIAIDTNQREVETPGSTSPQVRQEIAKLLKQVKALIKKHAAEMQRSRSYLELYAHV